ncbi:MAG: phage minor head protein [Pirellulales bacterium]|nr:phage minor head protein [Pirellulales bacterium]
MTTLDKIIGRGLIASEAIFDEFLRRFWRELRLADLQNPALIVAKARAILAELEPSFTSVIAIPQLAAWILGQKQISDKLPEFTRQQLRGWGGGNDPPRPPRLTLAAFGEDGPPVIRFPRIEQAANLMQTRGILDPADYYHAGDAIRANSFTMSGKVNEAILTRVRDVLAEQVQDGASLADFRRAMAGELEEATLGPAHLETVFRTNVQTAYSDGQEVLASNPVVAAVFPYQEYYATHDARTRPEHIALETLGLDGTGIYRRDDPLWDMFTPPWGFNCRCTVNLLTIRQAADRGVKEAQLWLRTGREPINPEWRIAAIPFRPPVGWGQRRKLVAA